VCRDYVKAVVAHQEKYEAQLKAANLTPSNIVLIGCGAASWISKYRDDTGFKGPMFTDPEQKLYQALKVIKVNTSGELNASPSPYFTGSHVTGMMWFVYKAVTSVNSTGDMYQLGAEFVLDNGKALYHHFDKDPGDHDLIEDVFKAGGAKL
jgi:hypothetical protein